MPITPLKTSPVGGSGGIIPPAAGGLFRLLPSAFVSLDGEHASVCRGCHGGCAVRVTVADAEVTARYRPYIDTYIDAMETLSPLFGRMAQRLSE